MAQVLIRKGEWNNSTIVNKTFALVRGLRMGIKGPFLLVNGTGIDGYPQRNFRIFVRDPSDFEITGTDADNFQPAEPHGDPGRDLLYGDPNLNGRNLFANEATTIQETDDEVRDRINERFSILEQMSMAVTRGSIQGLVVWGASGVGKSFGVEAALNRDSLMDKLGFNVDAHDQNPRRINPTNRSFKPRYTFIKGHSTAPALYTTLYEYCEPNEIMVFDDCDGIFADEVSLNLLKAALDTSKNRTISWRSSNRNGTAAPNSFEFKAGVIFITNLNFDRILAKGNQRLAPHLTAIMSRCLCLDLTIDTHREKLLRIEQVARDMKMLELEFQLSSNEIDDVLEYVHQNAKRFRELSLRKVGQLATLRKGAGNWKQIANVTLLKNR